MAATGGGATSTWLPAWSFGSLASVALVAALVLWWAARNARPRGVASCSVLELPIVGALAFVLRNRSRVLDAFTDLCAASEALGCRTFTIKWLTSPRLILTTDPANVEHVLKTAFSNYPKGPVITRTFADLLGGGIFAVDGDAWKRQRQLFSHVFSDGEFKSTIVDAFTAHGAALDAVLAAAAASGAAVDVHALMHRFTLDAIASIAFGVSLHSLERPNQPFVAAFDAAQAATDARFFTPGWGVLGRCLRSEAVLRGSVRVLREFTAAVITERRAAGDWRTRRDVLSRAMTAVDDAGAPLYREDDAALRDIILSFMIAGRDTTAQALSWAVLQVAVAPPDVEARLVAEARACSSSGSGGGSGSGSGSGSGGGSGGAFAPSFEAIARDLRFARAVMQETLRLYPSVPKEWHQALQRDVLPDGTVVPAGAVVVHLPYAMGRSRAIWGPDAARFDPDRFVAHPQPSPWRFPAFLGGPRACLGSQMALSEAAFVLALVYRSYALTLAPAHQGAPGGVPHLDSLTLPQKRGLTVTVARRSPAPPGPPQ